MFHSFQEEENMPCDRHCFPCTKMKIRLIKLSFKYAWILGNWWGSKDFVVRPQQGLCTDKKLMIWTCVGHVCCIQCSAAKSQFAECCCNTLKNSSLIFGENYQEHCREKDLNSDSANHQLSWQHTQDLTDFFKPSLNSELTSYLHLNLYNLTSIYLIPG